MTRHTIRLPFFWFGWQGSLVEGELEWTVWRGDNQGGIQSQ